MARLVSLFLRSQTSRNAKSVLLFFFIILLLKEPKSSANANNQLEKRV